LWLDGETGGVRKAERAVSAAGAEEGFAAGEAAGVEDALDEAEDADGGGREEKRGEKVGFEILGDLEMGTVITVTGIENDWCSFERLVEV
jgi:hypothetical protein